MFKVVNISDSNMADNKYFENIYKLIDNKEFMEALIYILFTTRSYFLDCMLTKIKIKHKLTTTIELL